MTFDELDAAFNASEGVASDRPRFDADHDPSRTERYIKWPQVVRAHFWQVSFHDNCGDEHWASGKTQEEAIANLRAYLATIEAGTMPQYSRHGRGWPHAPGTSPAGVSHEP